MSSTESSSQLQGVAFSKNFHSLALITLPLPSTDVQINDRLVESSQILKELDRSEGLIRNNINCSALFESQQTPGSSSNSPPKKIKVLQCLFHTNYIACLLDDNRVCRIPYVMSLESCSNCDDSSSKPGGVTPNNSTGLSLASITSSVNVISSNTLSNQNVVSSAILTAGSNSPNTNSGVFVSGTAVSGLANRNPSSSLGLPFMDMNRNRQALRRRLMRNPRSRPLSNSPRNVTVPEDLIAQTQSVLTGRSRNVIIRELQRTNLDVNNALNNLLSRDDDEIDEDVEIIAQDELMSLLDSNYSDFIPNGDSPSSASGSEIATSYMRTLRNNWNWTDRLSSNNNRNRLFRNQNGNPPNKALNAPKKEANDSSYPFNTIDLNGPQEFWPCDDDRKFVSIASLHSELVALTDKGQLCQWRWSDSEPFKGQLVDGIAYYHPKVPPLGLLQEKVTLLSASCIRASVVTKTGKLATWIDESIAPLVIRLEHVATANMFDGCNPQVRVRNLFVSSLMSAVQLTNGQVYWWGIPPYSQRMRHVQKIINGAPPTGPLSCSSSAVIGTKSQSGQSINNSNLSSLPSSSSSSKSKKERKTPKEPEIVQGSYVRMVSSPIYQEGAIAFSTASGVPKVGQLIAPLRKWADKCHFRILTPTEIQARFQSSNSSIALNLRASNLTSSTLDTNNKGNLEMPPPPSPASSTCSENSLQPSLPKRAKRTSSVYSSSASVQDKSTVQPEVEVNIEEWRMEDLVFVEDGKSISKDLGKVIKIDGNFVAVKFNFSSLDQNRDFDSMFEECRIVQKQDLVLVRSESGQTTNKIFDFFQRLPKKINLPRDIQLLTATLTNFDLHCIAKLASGRCCYLVISVMSGKVDESYYMPNEFRPFNTTVTSPATSAPDQSLLKLYSSGETNSTTVIFCRDANGTLYPLEKNRFDYSITDPIQINLGPVTNIGLGVYQMPTNLQIADDKSYSVLVALSFEQQFLMPSILKPNVIRLQYALDCLTSMHPTSHSSIYELCDGNRNIFHAAVSACFPKKNKNLIDTSEFQVVAINNDDLHELSTSLPHLETDEQNPAAHFVLTTLLSSQVLSSHLFTLLTARDFQGFTPFMMAVSGRAYTAANYLFQSIVKISKNMAPSSKETFNELMTQMVYPKGSLPDHSPLYVLCTNDTCSFTWTGEEHINQDIFECRTCGLVGSLCCCTECARTCHRGHDCKLKRTSPTAYCDCWEKCKCKALISGSQITRFALLEALLLNTDLVMILNSRGENIILHLLRTAIRQLHEQKQYKVSKHKNTSRVRSVTSGTPRTGLNDTSTPDQDLDPPKFARKALERICRDWNAIKVMMLTGYRSWKADSNNDLNFYNGTATAFAYEEENYFLSRQDGTAILDKFLHILLTSTFLDLLKCLVDTMIIGLKQEKDDCGIVARRFVRSIGRVYFLVISEMNPSIFKSFGTTSRGQASSGNDPEMCEFLSAQDVLLIDKKSKSVPFVSHVRKCLVAFGPLAIRELAEIAESLIAPVRNGTVKPSESFWLATTFSTSESSSAQILDVPASVYAHQRDFIDPNTVDLPNDTASAQGASSLQDVNVLDEYENSQALSGDLDPVGVSNSNVGGVNISAPDLNANGSQDIDDDSDDTSNQDDSSFLSNADNASVAQRSVVTGATAGSDVGMLPMLFDDESINSNPDEDDEEEERDEDEEDEDRDDDGEEEASSVPETDANTDEENEAGGFLNNIRSGSFSRNANNFSFNVHPRRNGLQQLNWAFPPNSSGTTQNRRRPLSSYHVPSNTSGHESDISILNATVGLARGFGIMVRLVTDLLSITSNRRATQMNSWNTLTFTSSDILELHQYVEERFMPTWQWLISIMNSCEAHLRFGCAVTQRRGQPAQTTVTTSNTSSTSSADAVRNDLERTNRIMFGYPNRRDRQFLQRGVDSEIRTSGISSSNATSTSAIANGNNNSSTTNTLSEDNTTHKMDFHTYSMSLVRGHFDEHYDSLPVFDAYSYRHAAYVFDAFVFYARGGRFSMKNNDNQTSPFNPTITGQFGNTKRNDPFYQRPRSTLFHGCPSPDPFAVPHGEALPLSAKPHLLKNNSRVEELFAIPRPANSEEAKSYLHSMPAQMSICHPLDKPPLSATSRNFKSLSPSFVSPFSSKASVIVLAGTPKHEELSAGLTKKSSNSEKKVQDFEKQSSNDFFFSNLTKCDAFLGSWRLSMEIFGKIFIDDVGAEPLSVLNELAPFSHKEGRFRRDMENNRPGANIRELLLLNLERDRHLLLKQTFEELNRIYKGVSDKSCPIARLKVTFKDEPGEGSGVSRSFFSAFSEAVLSPDRFTAMNWFDTGRTRVENSQFSRMIRRSQNYLRIGNNNGVALIHRFLPPDSVGNPSNSSNQFLATLSLRVDAPPYRPAMSLSSSSMSDHMNELLSTRFSIGHGQDLHNRVMMLHPALASRITGMLLELPSESINFMLESEPDFQHAVNLAVDMINAHDEAAASAVIGEESLNASQTSTSQASQTPSSSSSRDDFEPLFYQPGPRGFYSPIAGKSSEARLNAFRNVGRIMGICLQLGDLCGITLNRHVIAQLFDEQPTWHDMAFFDQDMYESFRHLINDAQAPNAEELFNEMDFRFSIDLSPEEGGEERDLIPNGRNVRVTPENVLDYVRSYSLYRMQTAQFPAIEAMRKGIFDVIPKHTLRFFSPEEFHLLLNGIQDVNVQTLQSYVTFTNESGTQTGSSGNTNELLYFRRWFWWVVEHLTPQEKQDLMFFWTGSPALHPGAPEGYNPIPSVTIRPREDNYFVSSNTCISRLYVPLYSSRSILRQKLTLSIKDKTFSFI